MPNCALNGIMRIIKVRQDETQNRGRASHVTAEAETWRTQPGGVDRGQPPEAVKDKQQILPKGSWKVHIAADPSVSESWTPDL